MIRVALLDDFQDLGRTMGPWSRLQGRVAIEAFNEPILGEDRLAATLVPFEVIVVMRERTPFPRSLVERLPQLRLLITTGMHNAALDFEALAERG
jgi:phosphoglycerate dehydrogenase-like enzyme